MGRKSWLGIMLVWTGVVLIAAGFVNTGWRRVEAEGRAMGLNESVIRLHVVANSDSEADQALKRAVRDAVLDQVTPLFASVATPAEARAVMATAVPQIEAAARQVVAEQGFGYAVQVNLGKHAFPAKAYGSVFLPAGEYDALRVLIGEAAGANWWCVLFPPMCFLDWSTGLVLEPSPETGGKTTVALPRKPAPALVDEGSTKPVKVKAKLAVVEWWQSRRGKARPE